MQQLSPVVDPTVEHKHRPVLRPVELVTLAVEAEQRQTAGTVQRGVTTSSSSSVARLQPRGGRRLLARLLWSGRNC